MTTESHYETPEIDAQDAKLRTRIGELFRPALKKAKGRDICVFYARGRNGNVWYEENGRFVLKDLYAENIPEQLIAECEARGWYLVIVFQGRGPEFDSKRRRYDEMHPDIVFQIDYTAMGSLTAKIRALYAKLFEESVEATLSSPELTELFSHRGVSYFEEIEPGMRSDLTKISPALLSEYHRWKAIFETLRPKTVIGGRLGSYTALLQAANELGVVSASVTLGIGEEMLPPFAAGDETGDYDRMASPTVHLLWGAQQVELIRSRFPGHPSRLHASGRPRNDSFSSRTAQSGRLRDFLGLGPDTKIVVYGANHQTFWAKAGDDEVGTCCLAWPTYVETLDTLAASVADLDAVVVIKPHPSDNLDKIEALAETLPDHVRYVDPRSDLHNSDVLSDATVFVSTVSSMFSEALLAEVMPICLWVPDSAYLYDTGRQVVFSPISSTAFSLEELGEQVTHYLTDDDARTRMVESLSGNLVSIFGETDGGNAQRAVAAMFDVYEDIRLIQR